MTTISHAAKHQASASWSYWICFTFFPRKIRKLKVADSGSWTHIPDLSVTKLSFSLPKRVSGDRRSCGENQSYYWHLHWTLSTKTLTCVSISFLCEGKMPIHNVLFDKLLYNFRVFLLTVKNIKLTVLELISSKAVFMILFLWALVLSFTVYLMWKWF